MGIDPSDPQCDPFYEQMKQLDLVLLSHGGEEKAVEAKEDQKLGNPLLLRRPRCSQKTPHSVSKNPACYHL